MAKAKHTNGAGDGKAEREQLEAENRRLRHELEVLEVRAEIEALYLAKAPAPGSERAKALAVAQELLRAVHDAIHRLRADEGAPEAADGLRRMRRALHRVTFEDSLGPGQLVPVFHALRPLAKQPKKYGKDAVVKVLREQFFEYLARWDDEEIWRVLTARNFNVAMALMLNDKGFPMSENNVDRIRKGRKG